MTFASQMFDDVMEEDLKPKLLRNEYSSNNAKIRYEQTGLTRVVNHEFIEGMGNDQLSVLELALSSGTEAEFLDALPYQEERDYWEDAAREAYRDISQGLADADVENEWFHFYMREIKGTPLDEE